MIRRSPTRIELKLEDLGDFDYIQKFEKKKAPNAVPGTVGGISAADAQKFIRQDRIGFRPIRTGAATGGSGTSGTWPAAASGGSAVAADVITGVMTAEASTSTLEAQERAETTGSSGTAGSTGGTNRSTNNAIDNPADMDVSGDDADVVTPSNITAESNASNADMSLDESL